MCPSLKAKPGNNNNKVIKQSNIFISYLSLFDEFMPLKLFQINWKNTFADFLINWSYFFALYPICLIIQCSSKIIPFIHLSKMHVPLQLSPSAHHSIGSHQHFTVGSCGVSCPITAVAVGPLMPFYINLLNKQNNIFIS